MTSSDKRIKTNIEDVPDSLEALQQVNEIPCKYYEYIDSRLRGSGKTIGFIAQEVKKVLPIAVTETSQIIPDIDKILENISWSKTIIDNTTKYKMSCELDNVYDTKYRFFVSDLDDKTDSQQIEIIGNEDNTFTFEKEWKYIYCYGREVNDFHIIDKQKIFALHHSAIQELDKKIEEEKQKTVELQSKVTELQNENEST